MKILKSGYAFGRRKGTFSLKGPLQRHTKVIKLGLSMVLLKQSSVPQSAMPFIMIIEEFMCESIEERHLVYFTCYISTVFESGLSLIHSQ